MTTRPATLARHRVLHAAAMAEMRRRYRDPSLDLGDVARAIGTSPRQLQRVICDVGQTDFRSALLGVRVDAAKRLLVRGVAVHAVARRVGYAGPSGFVVAFTRQVGKPPSALHPSPLNYDAEWREKEKEHG